MKIAGLRSSLGLSSGLVCFVRWRFSTDSSFGSSVFSWWPPVGNSCGSGSASLMIRFGLKISGF